MATWQIVVLTVASVLLAQSVALFICARYMLPRLLPRFIVHVSTYIMRKAEDEARSFATNAAHNAMQDLRNDK